jgi:RNA polymerase sigma factor (sigma-70 family)
MNLQPFEYVVRDHGPTVLRVCRAVLGPDDAEDAWSETFLAALQAYPRLRPDSDVVAWLVTIAHRKAIDHVRAANRRAITLPELPDRAAPESAGWDESSGLWEALRMLPLKQRQTVAYHYLVGLPYRQIADIVGGSEDAARRAAADGIAALRTSTSQGALT